jgi:hypothetical protein
MGAFIVDVHGDTGLISLPDTKKMKASLAGSWVDEMFLYLKRQLRGQAHVERAKSGASNKIDVYQLTPVKLVKHPKHKKGRYSGLQHNARRAIKSFIKKCTRARRSANDSGGRKQKYPVRRCPGAALACRRHAAYMHG